MASPTVKLNTGAEIPVIGLGECYLIFTNVLIVDGLELG